MREQLAAQGMGVRRLVALRGDLPSGYGAGGEFQYASDLVAFIREETGRDFHIEVAAYPRCIRKPVRPRLTSKGPWPRCVQVPMPPLPSISTTAMRTSALWRDTYKLGADIPVVPGIMPISSSTQLMRVFRMPVAPRFRAGSGCACRAFGDDTASIKAFGLDVVTDLCDQLRSAGCPPCTSTP